MAAKRSKWRRHRRVKARIQPLREIILNFSIDTTKVNEAFAKVKEAFGLFGESVNRAGESMIEATVPLPGWVPGKSLELGDRILFDGEIQEVTGIGTGSDRSLVGFSDLIDRLRDSMIGASVVPEDILFAPSLSELGEDRMNFVSINYAYEPDEEASADLFEELEEICASNVFGSKVHRLRFLAQELLRSVNPEMRSISGRVLEQCDRSDIMTPAEFRRIQRGECRDDA